MVISFFNCSGRLFWGWVSDKLGRRNTVFMLMLVTGTVIPFVIVAQSYAVFAVIAIVGFCYGGFLGVFPSLTADLFGMKNAGANYGIVLLGFGAGSILFTYVAGYFRDIGKVSTAFFIASGVSFVGAVLLLLLNLSLRKSGKRAIEQVKA
jgi:OFA family oxalate/formate antiporter-like MFS transporter